MRQPSAVRRKRPSAAAAKRLLTPGRIAAAAIAVFLVSGRCNEQVTAEDAALQPTLQPLEPEQAEALEPEQAEALEPEQVEPLEPEQAAALEPEQVEPLEPGSETLVVGDPAVLAENDHFRVSTRAWELAGRRGTAWHVAVPLPLDGVSARVEASDGPVDFDALLPESDGDWAAINGGFYYPSGAPMGWVMSDGVEANAHARGGGSGVFQVVDGQPAIVHQSDHDPAASNAVQSIDRIVDDSASLMTSLLGRRAARSAVVITPTHVEFVVVADALSMSGPLTDTRLRLTSHLGMSLGGFAAYLVESTHAVAALNLDGAVSTHLAARVDGADIRVSGEQGTPNAVILMGGE